MPCKKYETVEDGEKTFWISTQFPFPIKVEDSEVTMEYQNIKMGALAESLFEIPPGYEKMAMPKSLRQRSKRYRGGFTMVLLPVFGKLQPYEINPSK